MVPCDQIQEIMLQQKGRVSVAFFFSHKHAKHSKKDENVEFSDVEDCNNIILVIS